MPNLFNLFRKPAWSAQQVNDAFSSALQSVNSVHNAGSPLSWKDLFGNLHPRDLRNEDSQLGLSAIYCAVNTYIGAITSLPRFVQKIDPNTQRPTKFVKTTDHPASRIWSHYANEELTSNEMMKSFVMDVLFIDGNWYALPEYDSMGRIFRCHYIHPSRIPRGNIKRAEGGEKLSNGRKAVKGVLIYKIMSAPSRTSTNEEHLLLTHDEIIHIKGLIPDSENFRSQGILENNARSAGLYDSSEEMGAKFYSRGYTNQMLLSTDKGLTAKVRQNLENAINESTTGGTALEDIFKTKILEHGLKPVHVGLPLDAMKFIETRAFSVEDVARWFSIPAFLLHSMMGTGSPPEDSDKLIVMWIQNGLGSFMNNLAVQFRDNFIPRSAQPLYRFDFQRLHLYKTVLNEFTQALRNLFEIGAIDRLTVAELVGVHLDPGDTTNTQRYVPANLVTVQHGLSLEKKAEVSIQVMEENILKLTQSREIEKENHEKPPETPPDASESTSTGEDDTEPGKSQEDANRDKKLSQAPPGKLSGNSRYLIKTALFNLFQGMHEYELRIVSQKQQSRPEDFTDAMNEWYPKFSDLLVTKLEPWAEVLDHFELENPKQLTTQWIQNSIEKLNDADFEESLRESFNNNFTQLIKDETHDHPGTE